HQARRALGEAQIVEAARGRRAVERYDERLAAERGDDGAGEPVHMDEVCTLGRASKREHHRNEHERREPGAALEVADEAGAVVGGQAEVAEGTGPYNFDLEPAGAQVLDRAADEAAGEV